MLPLILTVLKAVVFVAYVFGAYKFWCGFRQTNFTSSRILLTLFWPVCFALNPRYRQNFGRALRGR